MPQCRVRRGGLEEPIPGRRAAPIGRVRAIARGRDGGKAIVRPPNPRMIRSVSSRHFLQKQPTRLTILGGGIAGLATALYAGRRGIPFTVHEASAQIGGNCRTSRHGEFLFDTGAHRFHDKDPEITRDVEDLLGDALRPVRVPSQISWNGRFLDFPLAPMNLVRQLGGLTVVRAGLEVTGARMRRRVPAENFLHFATRTYGTTIAERFLLNYSEKLWGLPADRLSPRVSGNRLRGLTLRTVLSEILRRSHSGSRHMDGSFYYPDGGIGMIAKRMVDEIGRDRVRLGSAVKRVTLRGSRITSVEFTDGTAVDVDWVASTIPIGHLVSCLDPPAPATIRGHAERLHFRRLVLVAVFIASPAVTANASVYFPDPSFPFTRVYEPRNRSAVMSPPGCSSLVAEIPCEDVGGAWDLEDRELISMVRVPLEQIGWLHGREVIDWTVERIPCAYPVLEHGVEHAVREIDDFLRGIVNLKVSGRNGRFAYGHIHDVMRSGKDLVGELAAHRDGP